MANDFDILVGRIESANQVLQNNARVVINRHVTTKAWLTGYYIVEYEQHGADRAKYGERLLQNLAERLKDTKSYSYRNLRLYRQFYLTYKSLNSQVADFLLSLPSIWQTPSAKLKLIGNEDDEIWQSLSANSQIEKSNDMVFRVEDLAYFRQNIQQPDDNAPVGILMCTEVGQEMVEYLASDMDEEMFISKYKLEIPDKNKMMEFLRRQNQ